MPAQGSEFSRNFIVAESILFRVDIKINPETWGHISFNTPGKDALRWVFPFDPHDLSETNTLSIYDRRRNSLKLRDDEFSMPLARSRHVLPTGDRFPDVVLQEPAFLTLVRRVTGDGGASHVILDDLDDSHGKLTEHIREIAGSANEVHDFTLRRWDVAYDRLVTVEPSEANWSWMRADTRQDGTQVINLAAITSAGSRVDVDEIGSNQINGSSYVI